MAFGSHQVLSFWLAPSHFNTRKQLSSPSLHATKALAQDMSSETILGADQMIGESILEDFHLAKAPGKNEEIYPVVMKSF